VASAFIVVQGGVVCTRSLGSGAFGNETRETGGLTSLTASDFAPAPGPDFSATGAPLQFGYQRANSSRFPIVLTHGIDNWRVTIRR
jgi:hypothetical protein